MLLSAQEIKHFQENKSEITEELLELLNAQIEQYPKESKMVISEIIYTRREK